MKTSNSSNFIEGVRLFVLLLLCSCSSPSLAKQAVDPNVFYKRDFDFIVNGIQGSGAMVAKNASEYKIIMRSSGLLDLLTIESCHRELSVEKASRTTEVERRGIGRLFRKKPKIEEDKRSFEYIYQPASEIEDAGACPLLLGGYDRDGRHSWGIIDFEDPGWKLESTLRCNGETSKHIGVSICQSKQGLIQYITFEVPVKISPDPKCPLNKLDDKGFEIPLIRGRCVYVFQEKEGEKRIHRLTTLGFERILIREVL